MIKRILLGIAIIGIYTMGHAIDPTIYRGNKNVWGGIYITSATASPSSGDARSGSTSTPVISSTTYINKADVTLINDPNGTNVFLSNSASMSTVSGSDCVKLYPGQSISCGGKNLDAIYARTLAGSTNGTTVWYIISYQDK